MRAVDLISRAFPSAILRHGFDVQRKINDRCSVGPTTGIFRLAYGFLSGVRNRVGCLTGSLGRKGAMPYGTATMARLLGCKVVANLCGRSAHVQDVVEAHQINVLLIRPTQLHQHIGDCVLGRIDVLLSGSTWDGDIDARHEREKETSASANSSIEEIRCVGDRRSNARLIAVTALAERCHVDIAADKARTPIITGSGVGVRVRRC
ncbi:hypothetical protein D3C71_315380 [compost metagenome]